MIKYLASALFLFSASATGIWIKSDGEVIEVPCPESFDSDRARLPQGCVNPQAGVWLSVARYKELEVEIAELKAANDGKDKVIGAHEQTIKDLRSNLLVCTAVPDCPVCPSTDLRSTFTGAAIGTAITLGGCFLWTQSH